MLVIITTISILFTNGSNKSWLQFTKNIIYLAKSREEKLHILSTKMYPIVITTIN